MSWSSHLHSQKKKRHFPHGFRRKVSWQTFMSLAWIVYLSIPEQMMVRKMRPLTEIKSASDPHGFICLESYKMLCKRCPKGRILDIQTMWISRVTLFPFYRSRQRISRNKIPEGWNDLPKQHIAKSPGAEVWSIILPALKSELFPLLRAACLQQQLSDSPIQHIRNLSYTY